MSREISEELLMIRCIMQSYDKRFLKKIDNALELWDSLYNEYGELRDFPDDVEENFFDEVRLGANASTTVQATLENLIRRR